MENAEVKPGTPAWNADILNSAPITVPTANPVTCLKKITQNAHKMMVFEKKKVTEEDMLCR